MPPAYKVVLLGDSSVGKTSLVHRFTTDCFEPHLANTIGAAFISKEYKCPNSPDSRTVKFEIWDTAGQERYKSLTPMYYRNAKTALVCFDMSSTDSFERAKYWIEQLSLLGPPDINIKVVGNKMDLEDDTDVLVAQFCRERLLPILKTSALLGTGVNELFEQIVAEIDQDFFDKYHEEIRETSDDRLLLNVRVRGGGCC